MIVKARSLALVGLVALAALGLSSCAIFTPLPKEAGLQERLNMFPAGSLPIEKPVTIHWNAQQVPFVEAQTDADAAFALGLVHAHLRLGQMEVIRRLSQARLSEIAGPIPLVADMEATLRIIDLGKTSKQVYAKMPKAEKEWLDRFVEGVNYYQRTVKKLPHEYALLGLERERWQSHEILTMGRLASVDVSWLVWFRLMEFRERDDWPELWARALDEGTESATSFAWADDEGINRLAELLSITAKWGSNSFAVHKSKTATGSSIIASDPHLGVGLPNLWVLAGVKSPSFHTVGLMVPGIPFVAVGRNPDIAWGGTNLRSASSDLIDVSSLPDDQIVTREIDVDVRWWFDRKIEVRDTPYGPLLSDSALVPSKEGEKFALKWIGHFETDEFSSMLQVNRARNWTEFRTALEGFSISAQNFIYADAEGNIGQVTATHLPARTKDLPDDIVLPIEAAAAWDNIVTSRDLPSAYNPDQGFVATANNKPSDAPIPIGYFFSGDDRVIRMAEVLGNGGGITVEDMKRLQTDTYMVSAANLRDAIVEQSASITDLTPAAQATLSLIKSWDARYDVDSTGAVAFQATVALLGPALLSPAELAVVESGGGVLDDYAAVLRASENGKIDAALAMALDSASEARAGGATWGDRHTLRIQHLFGGLPLIGGKYQFGEVPWPGSSHTIWKADHAITTESTPTRYGAQSRHVSDMSDLDSNWFVLLGGNDGWINSENFLDQVDEFGRGEMFHVPLRMESVREAFPHKMVLSP